MLPTIYEGVEGKRKQKVRDPMWRAKIHKVARFEGGYVVDTEGNTHLIAKVLPVPKETPDTRQDPTGRKAGIQEDLEEELRDSGLVKKIKEFIRKYGGRVKIAALGQELGLTTTHKAKLDEMFGEVAKPVDILREFPEKFIIDNAMVSLASRNASQGRHSPACGGAGKGHQ